MKQTKEKKKIRKGDFGYFRAEKKRRALITAVLFGVPLFIFGTAWLYFKTRLTIWTVIAVVGCIPACKSMVDMIMIGLQKPMDAGLYEEIRSHAGGLTMSYEMYMTFYEKSAGIDAIAVCGNSVVGYSTDPKMDVEFMAREAQKIIRKNGYKVDVKFLKEKRPFLERLDSMNQHADSLRKDIKFTPDERYPDFSREDMIKRTILAICL